MAPVTTLVFAILMASLSDAQAPVAGPPAGQALVVPVLAAPTRDYVPPTPGEFEALRVGVAHFQRRDFDRALEAFEQVVADNPRSALGLYELGLTHAERKEYQKAIDAGAKAADFKFPELARAYALIGNVLDWAGEPQRSIEVYRKGLEFAPALQGLLHYNMGVTFVNSLNDLSAAKAALKEAALADPTHASSQLMLAKLFLRDSLGTPGLLASARFLILEPASPRIQEAYTLWYHVISGKLVQNADGSSRLSVNPDQSKSEGDLTKLDLFISMSRISAMAATDTTEIRRMAGQVESLLSAYATSAAGDDAGSFLWTYYMPYFLELRERGFVEPFVYYISQRTPFPGVREWLGANQDRVSAFLAWSQAYKWPTPGRTP